MCNLSLNISEEALNEGRILGHKEGRKEGLKEGIEKGMEKGLKEGENRALNKTAIRLLSMGLSVEDVVKGTGLSAETVEKIKANMEEK
ncbi:hypothetical protein [uncultured Dialister sp.]|uniref:hypothetical protein n=1 Tax=uncultured Dialister sp. TaxID=278064 RepID=UPI0025D69A2F|nr:hypothetical protein [uncultured Dialister sp.]